MMVRVPRPFPPVSLLSRLPGLMPGLLLCLLWTGCGGTNNAAPVAPPAQPAPPVPAGVNPFSRVVVMGDSLAAGFQNGSLLDRQQKGGWAALLAGQAGFALTLPLIAAPGIPNVIELVQASFPPDVQQAAGSSAGRENPGAAVNDLAVPGHKLYDLLNTAPVAQPATSDQIITNLVLGVPGRLTGTQLQQALGQQPTTVYVWIGSDDALAADTHGDPAAMTPAATFSGEFAQMMAALKNNTSAHLFVANLPDVTVVPYLTTATELLAYAQQLTGVSAEILGPLLGISTGDLITPNGLVAVEANLQAIARLQLPTALPTEDVLTPAEVATVQAMVDSYNAAIAQAVAANGGTLVDVHSYINGLARNGITINGYAASDLYLGGLFGLDGIHPSNTGYALLANLFIASTNTALGGLLPSPVPAVDVSAVAAADPLFGPNRPHSTLPYSRLPMSAQTASTMESVLFGSIGR